jgi:hypothetical protein
MSSKKVKSSSTELQNKKSAENAQDIEENGKELEVKCIWCEEKGFKCMKWLSRKFSPSIKCSQCVRKRIPCEMPSIMAGGLQSDHEEQEQKSDSESERSGNEEEVEVIEEVSVLL